MVRISTTVSVLLLLVINAAHAQTHVIQQSEISVSGSASFEPNGEIRLTNELLNQTGTAVINRTICAKEYQVKLETFLGSNTTSNGGAGVFINEIDLMGTNISGMGLDTYFDSSLVRDFEPNGNHIEAWSNLAPANQQGTPYPGGAGFGPVGTVVPTFLLEGSDWMHSTIHVNEGIVWITVTHPSGRVAIVGGKRSYTPGQSVKWYVYGQTGFVRNIQKVRNISYHILRDDNCSGTPYLSFDQALASAASTCGALDLTMCSAAENYTACFENAVVALRAASQIPAETETALLRRLADQTVYCGAYADGRTSIDLAGEKQASYDEGLATGYLAGFQDGVASINQDAIRQSGFAAGVASIDQDAIRQTSFAAGVASINQDALRSEGYGSGYQAGFASGAASIDQNAIRQSGYDAGFSAGYSSVDRNAIHQAGFDEGYSSVDQEALEQAGYDSGFAAGYSSVDQDALRQAGYDLGFGAGYSSVDQNALVQSGFTAGVASVDTSSFYTSGFSAGRSEGFDAGFDSGAASINQGAIRQSGYDEGFVAGAASIDTTEAEEQAYARGYSDGLASAPACEFPAPDHKLKLQAFPSSSCETRRWRVKNQNSYDVLVTWDIQGSSQGGTLIVGAKSDAFFESSTAQGLNTARIHVNGQLQDSQGAHSCTGWVKTSENSGKKDKK